MNRHLFLLRELVRRDFEARYAGSVLGLLWSFVQPLWQLLLFSFVFSMVVRVSLAEEATTSFAVFLFCALLPWSAVHDAVLRSATTITDHGSLVSKLRFPSQMLVLAAVISSLLHQAIAGLLFGVVLAAGGHLALESLPWLLVALPLQVALMVGLGLFVAAVQVFFRDTVQALTLVFSGWFYVTPIVYPLALVPERFRPWVELNPLTSLVALYRCALLGPSPAGLPSLWPLILTACLVLVGGAWVFARLRPAFGDEL